MSAYAQDIHDLWGAHAHARVFPHIFTHAVNDAASHMHSIILAYRVYCMFTHTHMHMHMHTTVRTSCAFALALALALVFMLVYAHAPS
jgi:hypothetical protein